MTDVLLLDAGVLGQASHPRRNPAFAQWLDRLLTTDTAVMIPDIADYEIRHELLRARREVGIRRLDQLKEALTYPPSILAQHSNHVNCWPQ